MNYQAHIIVSLLALLLVYFFGYPITPIAVLLIVFGALFPDIDHPKSKISQIFKYLVPIVVFYLIYTTYKILYVSLALAVISLFLLYLLRPRHRGWIHSLFALGLFSLIVYLLTKSVYYASIFGLGYFSHLLADTEIKVI